MRRIDTRIVNWIRRWRKPQRNAPRADYGFANRSQPEADKWALSEFILDRLVPIVGVRPFPFDELLLMCSTVAYFKPDLIVEWGTHIGSSARVFYETVQYLGLTTPIHSIDLPPSSAHIENLADPHRRAHLVAGLPVQLHLGDGLDTAKQILAGHSSNYPLAFLDGDHAYESVRRELHSLKQVMPQAVVLVHDSFYQGSNSGYNCGPYDALMEFVHTFNLPLYSTVLGLPGMSLTYWQADSSD